MSVERFFNVEISDAFVSDLNWLKDSESKIENGHIVYQYNQALKVLYEQEIKNSLLVSSTENVVLPFLFLMRHTLEIGLKNAIIWHINYYYYFNRNKFTKEGFEKDLMMCTKEKSNRDGSFC